MKRLWHLCWIVPLVFFGFLFVRADYDLRYLFRVLHHRKSSTDDYKWKDSRPIAASAPRPWPEVSACPRVDAAYGGRMATDLASGGALAFVVVTHGAIACEWYGNGGARDKPAAAFSISKTVTALLLARAVETGKIGLDDSITKAIPELAARDARFAAITIASLVDMRSGIAFDEEAHFPWVDQDGSRVYYASDLAANVIEYPRVESAPGPFVYNDYAPNLVGLAMSRSGVPVLDAARTLWNEIGSEYPAAWSVDGRGTPWLETGFVVTARDLARIGQLLLEDGPAKWIARTRDPVGRSVAAVFDGTSLGYRNGWWIMGERAFVGMGRYGQILVVVPATQTVIVRLGTDGHDETNVSLARRLVAIAEAL